MSRIRGDTFYLSTERSDLFDADLQKGREGEQGHFNVVCRDTAGQQMTRGGEHVLVSIVHKDKKNWWVSGALAKALWRCSCILPPSCSGQQRTLHPWTVSLLSGTPPSGFSCLFKGSPTRQKCFYWNEYHAWSHCGYWDNTCCVLMCPHRPLSFCTHESCCWFHISHQHR